MGYVTMCMNPQQAFKDILFGLELIHHNVFRSVSENRVICDNGVERERERDALASMAAKDYLTLY